MYKDVKKKLLSVALCICMIIGMVQVVPKVKAAISTNQTVHATHTSGITVTFDITLDWASRPYDGTDRLPSITYWTCTPQSGNFAYNYEDHKNAVQILRPAGGAPTDAGSYGCQLTSTEWSFNSTDTIQYTIDPVNIGGSLDAKLDDSAYVQAYTGQSVAPQAADITVTARIGNQTKSIDPSQYTVTGGQTGCGEASCTVELSQTNYIATPYTKSVGYVIAYEMGGSYCPVEMNAVEFPFNGSTKTPVITLKPAGSGSITVNENDFSVTYYKNGQETSVNSAGDYTVKVTPKGGRESFGISNGIYFTGQYEAPFRVIPMDTSRLKVWAKDPATGQEVELSTSSSDSGRLSLPYAGGKPVQPEITKVALSDSAQNIAANCQINYPDATQVGIARIEIKPDTSATNYDGTIQVYYSITSGIKITQFQFTGTGVAAGETRIEYDAQAHTLQGNDCTVTNAAGAKLTKDLDYTVKYQYWNENTQAYEDVMNSSLELKNVGKKRVVIIGLGAYKDNPVSLDYEITPINIANGQIKVTFENGANFPFTGEAIVPEIKTVEYNGNTVPEDTIKDEFEWWCDQGTNINAGKVALHIRGLGKNYTGVNQVEFNITKLDMDLADADPKSYEYTGSGITPTIKIGAYTLRPTDFKILYYDRDSNQKTAPSDVGTQHAVTILVTSSNINYGALQKRTIMYDITQREIKETDVHLTGVTMQNGTPTIEWNGGRTRPGVIVGSGSWIEGTDYELSYADDSVVSVATSAAVTVTGKGNYTGRVEITYVITPRDLTSEGMQPRLTVTSADKKPDYTITIKLTDTKRTLKEQQLVAGTDYEVSEIWYWDGVPKEDESDDEPDETWEELTSGKDYTFDSTNATVSGLERAGIYRITIVGKGSYKGGRPEERACGTDISSYWVHIDDGQVSLPYTGKEQSPGKYSLYTKANQPVDSIIYSDTDPDDRDFTVGFERTDGRTKVTEAVGRVYVIATGNPKKGYFGKTKRCVPDETYNYFDITAPRWTEQNLQVSGTAVVYQPKGETDIPVITVTFSGIRLIQGHDYELEGTDKPELKNAGTHTISVVGKGNYAGNRYVYTYSVAHVDIGSATVREETTETSYNDITKGNIKLFHSDYQLEEGNQEDKKDYTKSIKYVNGKPTVKDPADGKYYVTYEVRGYGNYCGLREVKVPVTTVDLSQVTFADSKETAKTGEFYVEWDLSELLIIDPDKPEKDRTQVTPAAFTIGYKVSDTQTINLVKDTDYEIGGYGKNQGAGNKTDNYVTIQGIGGYNGHRQLLFTLYTSIEQAKLTATSFIQDGAQIKKSVWKSLYEQNGTDALLELSPLSFDEKLHIAPEEYNLSWTAGLDLENPAAGKYTVVVSGGHKESHYYHGSITFNFTIVDDIEGAQIVVGQNNTALYQGKDKPVIVTAAGVGITVKVDGKTLTLGTDYEITGHANNTQLGEATVSLKGIGQYTGDVSHKFKITYPISKLIVFVEDSNNGVWVDTRTGTVQYRYTGNPVEPAIRLYCPVDFPADATAEDYLDGEELPNTIYATEFLNNTNAGTATIVIKNTPYFTDGGANPRRFISFQIGTASICPPTVKYESSKYGDVNTMNVDYMGENYEVDKDFGITLHDGVLELKENEHYRVYFDGDRKNVSDPSRLPVIHFSGLGNYAGSEHEIPFTIRARSIKDALVDAQDVNLVYTDNMKEQQILDKLKLVLTTPRDRKQNLVFDTDYTIAGYYMDAGCTHRVPVDKGVVSESGRVIPNVPGDYYVQVVGKGNFKDERAVHIVITKRDLTDDIKIAFVSSMDSSCIVVDGVPDCTYNGEEHRPAVEVTYGIDSIKLRENRDYTVSYDNNVNAGDTAKVTVTMIDNSNYKGSAERFFTIMRKDIGGEDMSYLDKDGKAYPDEVRYDWTKQPVRPTNFGKISDMSLRTDLVENTDYTIEYHDDNEDNNEQRNAGKVKMTFVGSGNYTGEKVFTYYIGEDISRAYTLVNGKRSLSVEYNGLMQAPKEDAISVEVSGSDTLDLITAEGEKRYAIKYFKNGFEYENRVEAKDIVDAGTYYVAVVGVPSLGTYAKSSEENTCTYVVQPRNIGPSYILVSGYDGAYYYTGHAIEPKGLTVEDTDLPVSSGANDLQKRSVKLTNGVDYTVGYANNISAGKASIIVTGKGNYTGTRTAYFNILSSSTDGNNTWNGSSEGTGSISNGTTTIAASDIILGFDNSTYDCMMYNGYERTPTISINGINANEFTVTASNNVRPGVATLMITGRGNNYTGTILKNYKIMADLSKYGTIAAIEDQVYTGYQITPQVTLTCGGNLLNQGSDYTVTYMNNTNVGRATVTATASSDSYYVGSATGSFNISNTAGGMEITGYASSYTYTGYAITPDVVVTMNGRLLNRGTDYVVSYSNNTNVGTATMTVNGIGSFSGTKTINYTIEAKNIENCITTAVTNYKYTGNTYTPSVTITDSSTGKTLVAGTDYTIVYSNNTNPGTASITVTALSKNYTGTKVIPFKITSAAVSGLRTSAIKNSSLKLSWTSQDYADGYQICNSKNRVIATTRKNSYTVKGLNSCTTYKYKVRSFVENADGSRSYGSFSTAVSAKTRLNTPKLKAVSTKKGKVTLTWTKISKATGYEIYYSTKKNGIYTRLKTISKSSTRKYVDSGLASGEKYYYTIRAYRTTNGVKTYSSYNTIKAARVK